MRDAKIRRRAAVGLSATAGAFLAAAASPFATTPPAKADFEDLIIDLIDPGSIAAAAEAASVAAAADPASIGAAVDPASIAAAVDPASLAAVADPATLAAAADTASSAAAVDPTSLAAVADPAASPAAADPAGTFDLASFLAQFFVGNGTTDNPALAEAFQQGFWQPVHTFIQDWINSSFGESVDKEVNSLFQVPSGFCGMICDGTAGTQADPTGGNGGLLAGDGGAGWDSTVAGVAGGNGGNAEGIGDGGAGGVGGLGGL